MSSGQDTTLSPSSRAPVRDSSQSRVPVLVFVADPETEAVLRAGLLEVVQNLEARRGTILHAIRYLAKEATPRVLIVDISHVPNPLSELENLARVCTPDVTVLVIGEEANIGFYRELIHSIGVAEYVHKPLTRDNVTRLLAPHVGGVAMDAKVARGGNVIAVCGARGGVGATTVAVNLALQLSSTTRAHVGLLDLHLRQGTAALMLGVKPVGGLRIALEQPDRADALFLDRVSVEVTERLRLIAAEESLNDVLSPTPAGMQQVLDLLRHKFNYVVIDLPVPATLAEMQALRAARQLLVVMVPDLASLREANRLRHLATSLGLSLTTIVLNRADMRGGMKLPMIEEGIGIMPAVRIPELSKQMEKAANLGQPAVEQCAAFRRPIALLTREICGIGTNGIPKAGWPAIVGMFKK